MAIFKCKMCGGSLEVTEGMTVCECEYCGTSQTLPKTDNEQNLNMVNRANHFRQQCEFDKAMEIYERMLNQSGGDSEIYWSIVLCRYGIEYVDDPITKKKIPTCHRTQFKSILDDTDYLEAISHADVSQKAIYEEEARYIDNVQKGILEISNKEEPFDVFICYKESDDIGNRTPDSVLAQELYYQLKREGFKVFFSRITLEGKLGTAYEPYIFAALNSAKVMVVVGTRPEYFNAVWVRNEWSRFLILMQNDRNRTLIPAYKDMDPYDLPDALSMFQAQDMSKLGFMQDLIHGIRKIAGSETVQQSAIGNTGSVGISNTAPLLKRAFLFLDEGNWKSADEYCEKVLDLDPECSQAYLGKLFAAVKVKGLNELENSKVDLFSVPDFERACHFNDTEIADKLRAVAKQVRYHMKKEELDHEHTVGEFEALEREFRELGNYKDAEDITEIIHKKVQEMHYKEAVKMMNFDDKSDPYHFMKASNMFYSLSGYEDSEKKAEECSEKGKKLLETMKSQYAKAVEMSSKNKKQKLKEAIGIFESLGNYENSKSMIAECRNKLDRTANKSDSAKEVLSKIFCIIMYPLMPILVGAAYVVLDAITSDSPDLYPAICIGVLVIVLIMHCMWEYWQGRGFGRNFVLMQAVNIICFISSTLASVAYFVMGGSYSVYSEGFCLGACIAYFVIGCLGMFISFRIGEKRYYS